MRTCIRTFIPLVTIIWTSSFLYAQNYKPLAIRNESNAIRYPL